MHIPLFRITSDEIVIRRFGYVDRYCYRPEDDIVNVMQVAMIQYKEDVGFIGTVDPMYQYWLPISATTYSTLFCDPVTPSLTYAYYLNADFNGQLMFLYTKEIMLQYSEVVPGFSARYQDMDLSKNYLFPTDKPYAPQPEILSDSKYGTAIYICYQDETNCSFDVTPQVIIPTEGRRYIVASKSVYYGSSFNALNKVEPATTMFFLNNDSLYEDG